MIRLTDIVLSLLVLTVALPVLLLVSVLIIFEDGLPVLYRQERIGKGAVPFNMYKFRSMRNRKEQGMAITVGKKDNRITRVGAFLRHYKIDELPQLFNVLKGDMSIVGPRPEVRRYTDLYTERQRQILEVRPGITDFASIAFRNENEILSGQPDPEKYYVEVIMPRKIELNQAFISNPSFGNYLRIIFLTIKKIIRP